MKSYKIVRKGDKFACKDLVEGHIIGADYNTPDDAYRESCKLLRKFNILFELSVPVELF